MKKLILFALAISLTACSHTAETPQDHTMAGMDHAPSVSDTQRLNESPRHHEWVEVPNGDRMVHTWVVYPEVRTKAPAVLVIHENRGLNDWARALADQIAEAGYIAVAPDLLSGFSEAYQRTSDFPDDDAARDALYQLDPTQVMADLQVVADYAKSIEASNGKLATAGFCWGGAQSFEFATQSDAADAVMVFYGTSPEDPEAYANITAPVYGFYGGNDERVNATIDQAKEAMEEEGKDYDIQIYYGAGHAFMRLGEAPDADPNNISARKGAWEQMRSILDGLGEGN
ncbi:MAG TPA: dienelactone hydrolase family protein [Candidatus Gracilibacteria bacterium]